MWLQVQRNNNSQLKDKDATCIRRKHLPRHVDWVQWQLIWTFCKCGYAIVFAYVVRKEFPLSVLLWLVHQINQGLGRRCEPSLAGQSFQGTQLIHHVKVEPAVVDLIIFVGGKAV